MNKKDLQFFRELLIEHRQALLFQMDHIKESEMNSTTKESSGDHSAYSFHMADQGTDNMEREKSFFYAERDGRALNLIEMALVRIEDGSFGKCQECGDYIHRDRLEAVPYAELCIGCKAREENMPRFNAFASGVE
ncbi:TraR/DksA C4-type zinc finger protein [bacterium]|nr:TraR/DksA C4-type zinc finger protein [bacterium]